MLFALGPEGCQVKAGEELRGWIRENEVCFEILPHHEFYHRSKLQVGFELTLFAVRPRLCQGGDPGCPACDASHAMLREIALCVLPPDVGYVIAPYHAAFHLRPETNWKSEVELVIELIDLDETFDAVDEDDRRDIRRVTKALEALGAQWKVWSARASNASVRSPRSIPT
jgi:hypothetical protein